MMLGGGSPWAEWNHKGLLLVVVGNAEEQVMWTKVGAASEKWGGGGKRRVE